MPRTVPNFFLGGDRGEEGKTVPGMGGMFEGGGVMINGTINAMVWREERKKGEKKEGGNGWEKWLCDLAERNFFTCRLNVS